MLVVELPKSFLLHGPKGRWYAFVIAGDGVNVSRFEDFDRVRAMFLSRPRARRLWAWLIKLGYVRTGESQ